MATLGAASLRLEMGLSGAATSIMVDRMTGSGHIVRQDHPTDRRRIILRHTALGMGVVQGFIASVNSRIHDGLEGFTDAELQAAHCTFVTLAAGMRLLRRELQGDAS